MFDGKMGCGDSCHNKVAAMHPRLRMYDAEKTGNTTTKKKNRQTDRSALRADGPPRKIQITTQQESHRHNNSPQIITTACFLKATETRNRAREEDLNTESNTCGPAPHVLGETQSSVMLRDLGKVHHVWIADHQMVTMLHEKIT